MCEDPRIDDSKSMASEAASTDERVTEPVTGGAEPSPSLQETRSADGTDQSSGATPELADDDREPADADDAEATAASDGRSSTDVEADVDDSETMPDDAFELEELTLPSSIVGLEPLAVGLRVGPDAMLQVEELRQQRGRLNIYRALPVVGPRAADGDRTP